MKKYSITLLLLVIFLSLMAQQKDFEGIITYNVLAKSKTKNYNDDFYKLLLAANGDRMIIYIKDGNYKQTLGVYEAYYIGKSKRCYYKFRNIDTLYYRDYSSDTTNVLDIVKSDSPITIGNYKCKSILIKRSSSSTYLVYTNDLHLNTTYDLENKIDNLNVFAKESGGGVWLYARNDYGGAFLTDSVSFVEQKSIDDHIFELPAYPLKNIQKGSLITMPKFPGNHIAWQNYLKKNLDGSVIPKILKNPQGQNETSENVIVSFLVSEDGSISNIHVSNEGEVNPKLAAEAMRVIRESPVWIPGTIYGIKVKMPVNQPVVFAAQ